MKWPPCYREYGELLQQYVRQDGRVDYDSLRRKRLWLKELLRTPDDLDPNTYHTWSPNEKLASWINTCNLKMLDVIVRNYAIEYTNFDWRLNDASRGY